MMTENMYWGHFVSWEIFNLSLLQSKTKHVFNAIFDQAYDAIWGVLLAIEQYYEE